MHAPARPALLVLVALVSVACGGGSTGGSGGGGSPGGSGSSPGGGGTTDGGSDAAVLFPGAPGLTLSAGSFWEFRALHRSASASGSGSSVHQRIAHLRLQLGAPERLAGLDAFPVQATVDRPDVDAVLVPRWKYLATNAHQLLGSEDGARFEVLFDGQAGHWAGPSGFFTPFSGQTDVGAAPARLDGGVVRAATLEVFAGKTQDFCRIVAGQTICDSQTASSAGKAEHYMSGIGPVAYVASSSVLGGSSAASDVRDIELTATSLAPSDRFRRVPDAWTPVADLPVPVSQPRVVGFGDRLWVLGGNTGSGRTTAVQILDPATGRWSTGPSLPRATGSIGAAVVSVDRSSSPRGLIPDITLWLLLDHDVYYLSPLSGRWVLDHAASAGDPVWIAGAELQAVGLGRYLYVFPTNPRPYTSQDTLAYDTFTGQWLHGNGWAPFSRAPCSSVVHDPLSGRMYSVSDASLLVFDPAVPFGADAISTGPADDTIGTCPAVARVGNVIVASGGTQGNGAWDATAIFDLATGTWREGPLLHVPRSSAGAAALGNAFYVVGGTTDGDPSAAVEVLSAAP